MRKLCTILECMCGTVMREISGKASKSIGHLSEKIGLIHPLLERTVLSSLRLSVFFPVITSSVYLILRVLRPVSYGLNKNVF